MCSVLSYELSAATSKILTQELESIQQLHEMEPDNKCKFLSRDSDESLFITLYLMKF